MRGVQREAGAPRLASTLSTTGSPSRAEARSAGGACFRRYLLALLLGVPGLFTAAPGLVVAPTALLLGALGLFAAAPAAAQVPAAPTNLKVTTDDTFLRLGWTKSTGATGYDLHYTSAPTSGNGEVTNSAAVQTGSSPSAAAGWVANPLDDRGSTATAIIDLILDLTNDITYRVRVRAKNDDGSSAWVFGTGTPTLVLQWPSGTTRTIEEGYSQEYIVGVSAAVSGTLTYAPGSSNPASLADDLTTGYPTTFSFTAGQQVLLEPETVDDAVNEEHETFTVTINAGTGYTLGTRAILTVTIQDNDPPPAPAALSLAAGNTKLTASWSKPVGPVAGYQLRYKEAAATDQTASTAGDPSTGWVTSTPSGTGTSAEITGLTNGTAYHVQVRATDGQTETGNGYGDWSASQTGTPLVVVSWTAGAATQTISEGLITSQSVLFTGLPAGASGSLTYAAGSNNPASLADDLQTYSTALAASSGELEITLPLPVDDALNEEHETFTITINPGTGYLVGSPATRTVTITDNDPPAAPSGLSLAAGDQKLTASWTKPAGPVTGYQLRYKETTATALTATTSGDPSTGWVTSTPSGTNTSAEITGLTNGTAYDVQVRATDGQTETGNGYGSWSAWQTGTPSNVPAAPTNLNVAAANTRLELTWTAPAGTLTGYDVHYTSAASGSVANSAVASGNNPATAWVAVTRSGTTASQTISSLSNGTPYRVRVRARNSSGNGAWVFGTGTPVAPAVSPITPTTPTTTTTPRPRDLRPSFGRARVPAQSYTEGTEIPPLELPEATGGNGRLFYALSPVLPEGLTLNRRVRRLSGTPTSPQAARQYTWTATDADGDAARITFTVTVAPDLRPSFDNVSVPDQSYTEGTEITPFVLPEATGGDGPLTYALSPVLPEGLTLNDVTRRLSGNPISPQDTTLYTWTVTDADGDEDELTFTVTVVPDRPSFDNVSVPDQSYTEGTAITPFVLPEATGGNNPLTYTLTPAPPNGLSLNEVTRRLSGNPISPQAATLYTWTVTDADGDEATLTFTIAIAVDPHRQRVREAARRILVEMARRAMSGALDTIGARFGAVGGSGLSLAGQPVSLESVASVADGVGMAVWNNQSLALGELLGESAFSLRLAATGNEDSGGDVNLEEEGPLWSVWGRGDLASFAGGREEETHYDGWLRSGWLGIDARSGRWVGGMALSHEQGQADYGATMAAAADDRPLQGRLETSLTALYPYGRWRLNDGMELQGVVGVGWGEARHTPADEQRETGTLSMRMASLGVRKSLPDVAGLALALRADAAVTRIETGNGPEVIHNLSADSWRLRTGLEASRRFAMEGEVFLEPFLEAAARQDGGDGLEGSGVELAGGLRYGAPNVAVELRGRWLAAHSEEGAEEQGVSLTARYGPGADGQGLFFALSPRWGAATGGAQALWGEDLPVLSTADAGNSGAVDAQVGYGFALPQGGVLTPFAEVGMAGSDSRRLRLGTRYAAAVTGLDMEVELAGERRESGDAAAEHALQLDVDLRF